MDNMKGLGAALPNKKGGKGKAAAAEEDSDEEFDPASLSAAERAQLASLVKGGLTSNPELIKALQGRLDGLVGRNSGYIDSLPSKVKRRVEHLEKLQEEHDALYETYKEEQRALDAKYAALYAPLYDKRSGVVTGSSDIEHPAGEEADQPAGIPEFWLTALRNHEMLDAQITEKDAAVLEHLVDIRTAPLGGEEHGFTLSFHFSENPFFSNTVLTKTYKWADEDEDMLELAKGTEIAWAAGKDTTVKVMKKKAKKGGKPLTKLEPCESFFRFFSPPDMPEEEDELTEEDAEALQEAVEADFELGAAIREEIIPQAVSWFTGAAVEAGDEDEEEDEEDDEDDDEDEEDDDEDDSPQKGKGKQQPKKGPKGPPGAAGDNPECKQQ